MKMISLLLKMTGGRGIAWHIRNIMEGRFYGEIRFDIPEKQRFNCKFIDGEFQQNDYALIVKLLENLEKAEGARQQNIRCWSMLIARNQVEGSRVFAGYFPGDENKTEIGKTYKDLLTIVESYLKPYYRYIIPEGETCISAIV